MKYLNLFIAGICASGTFQGAFAGSLEEAARQPSPHFVSSADGPSENDSLIVVVGFKPTKGMTESISMEVAKDLDGKAAAKKYRIESVILPNCDREAAAAISSIVLQEKPKALVFFANGPMFKFGLQREAFNKRNKGDEDLCGEVAESAAIVPDGPQILSSNVDLEKLAVELNKKDVKTDVTHDIYGDFHTYNLVYYDAMRLASAHQPGIKIVFSFLPYAVMMDGSSAQKGKKIVDEKSCLKAHGIYCHSQIKGWAEKWIETFAEGSL